MDRNTAPFALCCEVLSLEEGRGGRRGVNRALQEQLMQRQDMSRKQVNLPLEHRWGGCKEMSGGR